MLQFLFNNTPLVFFIQSFWRDEAFSYLLAKKNIFEIIVLSIRDFNPPLYYLILHFWMKILGSSEISLRLLSFIFFWATLYAAFLFMVNIIKTSFKRSFFYLGLFLINPFLNYYAFETRMYTLFAFLASLSFYFFYTKKFKAYIFVTVLGFYTHYFMLLAVLAQVVYSFLTVKKEIKLQSFFKSLFWIFIFFLPWVIMIINQKHFTGSFWISKPSLINVFNIPAIIYSGYDTNINTFNLFITLFSFYLLLIIFLGYWRRGNNHLFLFFSLWSLVPALLVFVISQIKPVFLPRYLIFTNTGLLLWLVLIFEKLNRKLALLLLMILITATLTYNRYQIKNRQKADIRKVVNEIKYLAKANDYLYVTSELNFHTAQYYFNENRVFIYGKNEREIPSYVGKVLIPKEKITNTLPHYPQKAFILKDDLSYSIEAVN